MSSVYFYHVSRQRIVLVRGCDSDCLYTRAQTEETMNLIDVTKQLATEDQCLDFLEKMRWPNGVRCIACESTNLSLITRTVDATKTRKEKKQNKRTRLYACLECGKRFTPTVGTVFQKSHLPLPIWFMAIAIVMDAKKGMSALQLKEHLGIGSYRTAWFMVHRI